MRTKVLLCAVALAASLASSMAQNVYSLNVVGYYNVTVPAGGLYAIANQLNTTNNTVAALLPSVPDGTILYKYISGSYQANTFVSFLGGWGTPTWTLNPGETAMIKDTGTGMTNTFVGEVLQGNLTNSLTLGGIVCFRSASVPLAGGPVAFGIPAEDGDLMYVYNYPAGYGSDTYVGFLGGWSANAGAGPAVNVGQGFAYKKAVTGTQSSWVQHFTVN